MATPARHHRSHSQGGFLSSLKRLYLCQYNAIETIGWGYVLFLVITHFANGGATANLWPSIAQPLMLVQTLAGMEIIHAALGLVRSDVFSTVVQLFSRILLADVVAPNVIEAQQHWGLTTMVVSWCLVELIRYPFYLFTALDQKPPAFLGWLRYSAFYILYPTGGSSEALMIYLGLGWFKKTKWGTLEMPNKHNFGWDMHLFLIIFMTSYAFGLPMMMMHMRAQRNSYLAKQKAAQAEAAGKKHQ